MATVHGTSGNDFIHVAGDGLVPPGGYTDNTGATNSDDVIDSGGSGSDIINAGLGDDQIGFGTDLDSTDQVNGGGGTDTLVINDQTTITFAANSLSGIENILLPFVFLPVGFAGSQSLTMNDANLAAGQTMHVDAGGVGADTFFTFDGSAETDGNYYVIGGAAGDTIIGGQNGNLFDMTHGGNDSVTGGAGYEDIFFGDTLTAADHIVIGGGDALVFGGPSYAAGLTFAASTLTSTGSTFLLDTGFGYKLIMDDANVTAGSTLHVQPNGNLTTQTVYFDGSAEKDGGFDVQGFNGDDVLIGGRNTDFFNPKGGNDTVNIAKGGQDFVNGLGGDDTIIAGAKFDALDRIDGGTESDTLTLSGNYSAGVVFDPITLLNVERIVLAAGNSYRLTTNETTVAAAALLTVSAGKLGAASTLTFDGSAEHDGRFVIVAGSGDDVLIGGAGDDKITGGLGGDDLTGGDGSDHFVYVSAAASTGVNYDIVRRANFLVDKFDVPGTITAIDTLIAHGPLSTATFDSDLALAADAVHLGAHHAVLFTPGKGDLAGKTFLVVDVDGAAGYQGGHDLVMQLVNPQNPGSIGTGDFI